MMNADTKTPLAWISRLCLAASLVFALSACKSHPLAPYSSPRIYGRVLDAENGQPVKHVQVWRGSIIDERDLKGGEQMMIKGPQKTDEQGRFTFRSERALFPFPWSGWHSVRLSFERSGYRRFSTNYTIVMATNSPAGEPLIEAGDIRMRKANAR